MTQLPFNIQAYLERIPEAYGMLDQVKEVFRASFADNKNQLMLAIETRDKALMARTAHRLQPVLAELHFQSLADSIQLARQLMETPDSGKQLHVVADDIKAQIHLLLQHVDLLGEKPVLAS